MNNTKTAALRRLLVAAACCAVATGASAVAVGGSGTGGSIPDGSLVGVRSTITLPATVGSITSLSVGVAITHTWVGDLVIQLEHNGRVLTLLDRPGLDPGNASGAGSPANLLASAPLVFNAAGAAAAESAGSGCSDAQTVGVNIGCLNTLFVPQQSLALYDGTTVGGSWTLGVFDHYAGDAGTLASWTLNADVSAVPEPADSALAALGVTALLLRKRFGR